MVTLRVLNLVVAGLFIVFLNFGCREQSTTVKDSTTSPQNPTSQNDLPVGTVDDTAGFTIRAIDDDANYTYTVRDYSGLFSSACTIYPTSTNKDLTCVIEGHELDLFYWGVSMQYNIPSSMCTYLRIKPFWYYAYQVRTGPTWVEYYVDSAGAKNTFSSENSEAYLNSDSVTCNYDYTVWTDPGPNCCLGSYTLRTYTWDTSLNAGAGGYPASPSSTTVQWGGNAGRCLDGPAVTSDGFGVDADGWPYSQISFVKNIGANSSLKITAPLSSRRGTNLYVANFFNINDHGGLWPLALRQPTFFSGANISWLPTGQPYYEFQCLDEAAEVNARIRVMIREWNLASELEKGDSGNADLGDGVTEPITGDENDYTDWKDLGGSFPGSGS